MTEEERGSLSPFLFLNYLESHLDGLRYGCLARLVADDGDAVLAQSLGHLLLSQAETLPLSPKAIFVHREIVTKCYLFGQTNPLRPTVRFCPV
jgi:hypothetical protein